MGGTKPCLSPPVLCTLHSPLHLISGDILDPWCWEASVEPGGDRSGSLVQARDGQAEGNDPVGGALGRHGALDAAFRSSTLLRTEQEYLSLRITRSL